MTLFANQIIVGDSKNVLGTLPVDSVSTVVTSPPYYSLRNYGVDGQIGQEATVELYIENLCSVLDQVYNVLAPTGTLWLNLGDTYSKSGNLLGVPWRVAIELQNRGWILRQEVIWHKTNPTPESARDRFSRSHEHLFLFSKQRSYYFNEEAAREPVKSDRAASRKAKRTGAGHAAIRGSRSPYDGTGETRKIRTVWTLSNRPFKGPHFAVFPVDLVEPCIACGCPPDGVVLDPFFGAGTTALAAEKLGRHWLGIELNPEYADLARSRIEQHRPIRSEIPSIGYVAWGLVA